MTELQLHLQGWNLNYAPPVAETENVQSSSRRTREQEQAHNSVVKAHLSVSGGQLILKQHQACITEEECHLTPSCDRPHLQQNSYSRIVKCTWLQGNLGIPVWAHNLGTLRHASPWGRYAKKRQRNSAHLCPWLRFHVILCIFRANGCRLFLCFCHFVDIISDTNVPGTFPPSWVLPG